MLMLPIAWFEASNAAEEAPFLGARAPKAQLGSKSSLQIALKNRTSGLIVVLTGIV